MQPAGLRYPRRVPRAARLALAALAYLGLVVGLFFYLFALPGSDDYAGWSLAVGALALPACLVVALDRERLGWIATTALAVPASLCLAGVALLMVVPMTWMSQNSLVMLGGILIVGPAAAIVISTIFIRRLVGMSVRVAARRIVAIVALSGAVATLAGAPLWWGFWDPEPFDLGLSVAPFLLGAIPLGWSLGPALLLLATRGDPEA